MRFGVARLNPQNETIKTKVARARKREKKSNIVFGTFLRAPDPLINTHKQLVCDFQAQKSGRN